MRILIVLSGAGGKKILVKLDRQEIIKDVKDLIEQRKHSKAIDIALQKGRLEREIRTDAFENSGTDLILREGSAHWDVTGKR